MCVLSVFFVKQKTAYEMRISDWSSDVCSSDLDADPHRHGDVSRLGGHSAARSADLRPADAAAHVPVRRAGRIAGRGGPVGRSGNRKAEDAALVRGGLHGEHADVV